jgi:hypothetical protein
MPARVLDGAPDTILEALNTVEELCRLHEIRALDDFLESCRVFAREETLNVAVLGRFKAGKSSFLNHLLGRPLLPVGVLPVTSVVTEIQWGPEERAGILFADGRREQVPVEGIGDFIAEDRNPENHKQVLRAHRPGLRTSARGTRPRPAVADARRFRRATRGDIAPQAGFPVGGMCRPSERRSTGSGSCRLPARGAAA